MIMHSINIKRKSELIRCYYFHFYHVVIREEKPYLSLALKHVQLKTCNEFLIRGLLNTHAGAIDAHEIFPAQRRCEVCNKVP